jgi:hypothetical protein
MNRSPLLARPTPAVAHPAGRDPIQKKVRIGAANDPLEREADRAADAVMRGETVGALGSAPLAAQRKCAGCEAEGDKEDLVQRKCATCESAGTGREGAGEAAATAVAAGGAPLSQELRSYFEPRFGHDFSGVRVHTDAQAAGAANAIGARAYTLGSHLGFASGEFAPSAPVGRRLIAHELAHVAQQTGDAGFIRRQIGPTQNPLQQVDDMDAAAEREYAKSGAPKAVTCAPENDCPPAFCTPYASEKLAEYYRAKNGPWLMAGIRMAVDSRVMPLWREYLNGGSSPKNLTADFAKDFTNSLTTLSRTQFLRQELASSLASNPPAVSTTAKIDIKTLIPAALASLNDRWSPDQMNFNHPKEIPGNIAGGIGDNQTACAAGKRPSPFNDERLAYGYVNLTRVSPSEVSVSPIIAYKVQDTIDLCPGDCGNRFWPPEQVATVPLSQFEATGISGDVPFTIYFPSPWLGNFTISAATPASSPPTSTGAASKKTGH